ncbi:MAG TPA: Xaa-Pro peptidase family protein [Stellaceae bacterium]|nr:Xaa-Pro peptidase family protein [Stellaceae bacterium]
MDRTDRLKRVLRRMEADKVDTLVALSAARHSMARPDAATHLSGFRSLGESAFVLFGDGTQRLVITPAYDEERAVLRRPEAGIVATDDLAASLARILAERGMKVGRIATTGLAGLPYALAAQVLKSVGTDAVAFDETVLAVTAPKTDEELANARKAAVIAEQGFAELLATARPGMRECDLAVQMNLFTKSLGADDNFLMMSALPHGYGVAASSHRPLQKGDVLVAEFTPSYQGQFTQICRTVSIGAPSNVLAEKYALVVRAMEAGIAAVRPGVPVSAVCGAIDAVLTEAGYGDYCRPPHMKRRGHGMGCGSMAPGDISIDNQTPLEPDMLFVVHPNQYLPETGYLLCGEPVRVTETGGEALTTRWAALGSIDA